MDQLYEKIEEIDYLFPDTSIKKQNSTELFKKIKEDVVKKGKIAQRLSILEKHSSSDSLK